jgi:hypothetical protein
MRLRQVTRHAGVVVALFTACTLEAAKPLYDLKVLVSGNSVISGLKIMLSDSTFALNDLGNVIFTGHYDDGTEGGARGVFALDHVVLKAGDTVRGLSVGTTGICGLNNSNQMALSFTFLSSTSTPASAIFSTLGQFVRTGDTIGGLTIQFLRECALNDLGELVFSADYLDSSGAMGTGVFTPDKVLLKTGSVVDGIPLSGNNSFNRLSGLSDLGTFVFDTSGSVPGLGTSYTGAFTQHRLIAGNGQTIKGIQLLAVGDPVISHLDRVAFGGTYNDSSCLPNVCARYAAFTPDSVIAKPGDKISGLTVTSATPLGINDAGTVLLIAGYKDQQGISRSGLFTKNAAIALFGENVNGSPIGGFGSAAINNPGDVVFSIDGALVLATRK